MKNRSWRWMLFMFLGGLLMAPPNARAAEEAVRVEKGVPQLFVDDLLIQSQDGLKRTLRQPKKDDGGRKPILALEDEFGEIPGTLEANGTIVYDPKLKKYVMFAIAFAPTLRQWDRVRIYRFTSDDAMNWIKGDDGEPQLVYPRSADDLLDPASGARASNLDLFSCYYDPSDANYPYKAWQWFANWGDDREGVYFMRSADGINWERGQKIVELTSRKIEQDGRTLHGPGDVTTFYYDQPEDRYLALVKFYSREPVGPKNHLRSRAYTFVKNLDEPLDMQRIDRVELVPAAADANGDKPHDEYYASSGWRYGPLWLGELKIWHGGGDYPYSAAGCAFNKLVVSRDGLNWTKVPFDNDSGVPEVFLPNGEEGGNGGRNDGGYMSLFSQGPLRIGDELILYYGSSSWGKNHPDGKRVTGGGIFRARLRPDGFVSVDRGTLTTRPLQIEGDELYVNAVGPVKVELLDASGNAQASAQITGDSLRHAVRFDGKRLGELKSDRPAQLRFTIGEGGQLYSFTAE